LVEERALDGSFAAAEQLKETIDFDFQRLNAAGGKVSSVGDAEPAETSGIDEAQLPTGGQFEDGVGVLGDIRLRIADLQAASHAEMDDPLSLDSGGAAAPPPPLLAGWMSPQLIRL